MQPSPLPPSPPLYTSTLFAQGPSNPLHQNNYFSCWCNANIEVGFRLFAGPREPSFSALVLLARWNSIPLCINIYVNYVRYIGVCVNLASIVFRARLLAATLGCSFRFVIKYMHLVPTNLVQRIRVVIHQRSLLDIYIFGEHIKSRRQPLSRVLLLLLSHIHINSSLFFSFCVERWKYKGKQLKKDDAVENLVFIKFYPKSQKICHQFFPWCILAWKNTRERFISKIVFSSLTILWQSGIFNIT
jgi:hypothetical protein